MGFLDAMSETDVERLLAGRPPASSDPQLEELAAFVRSLTATVPVTPPDPDPALIARLAQTAAAGSGDARPSAPPAPRRRSRFALVARLGVVAASLLVLTAGLAVAGVNLPGPAQDAFEKIGIELPNQTDDAADASDGDEAGGKSGSAGKAEPRSRRQAHGPAKSANPDPNGEAVRRGPNPAPGTPRGKPDTSLSDGSNAGGSADSGGSGGNSSFGQSQGKRRASE